MYQRYRLGDSVRVNNEFGTVVGHVGMKDGSWDLMVKLQSEKVRVRQSDDGTMTKVEP